MIIENESERKMAKKNNNFRFDLDDLDFDLDNIDFASIGQKIKNSVTSAINGFSRGFSTNLPAIRDPNVCEQKNPIGPGRVNGLKFFAVLIGITCISIGLDDLLYNGLANFIFKSLLIGVGIGIPIYMWQIANNNKRLAINYSRFKRELGQNTIISIKDLASAVSQSEKQTINDLLYFMKQNYFKQARIVENDSIFILDIPTFKLYKEKIAGLPYYKREEITDDVSVEDINKDQAENIITNSDQILEKMNKSGSNIRSESFKAKLSVLFTNIADILNIVKKYPQKATSLTKFNDYYMPTSLKLIETFEEFELMNTDDMKIRKAMAEIENSIKTIGEAFDNIKVDLLSDRAMDVKTDIDTIELILNQEGLLENDWSEK